MQYQTFQDFDAFAESVEDADLQFTLPRMEFPKWSISKLDLGALHVQVAREGGGNIAEGVTRPDGHVLYVQKSGTWARANGVRLGPRSILVLGPGAGFCIASEDAHDWVSVFIPAELVPLDQDSNRRGTQVLPAALPMIRRFNRIIDILVPDGAPQTAVLDEPASLNAIRSELAHTIGELLKTSCEPQRENTGRPVLCREELIQFTVALIEDHPEMSPTVQNMAVAAAVSDRTLRTVFLEYFGVPPLKYMQVRRLHQARKLLRNGGPEGITVAGTAAKFGFWDLGRFASKYQRLFGELPSETLKIKRGT